MNDKNIAIIGLTGLSVYLLSKYRENALMCTMNYMNEISNDYYIIPKIKMQRIDLIPDWIPLIGGLL